MVVVWKLRFITLECADFSRGSVMPEIRFEAKTETVAVIDGFCSATGKCRTSLSGSSVLESWAKEKLHEAMIVCRVAGVDPSVPEAARK